MRTNSRRRLIHRDCRAFSGLFLPGCSRPAAPGKAGRDERAPPPRGDAQPVGHPQAKPPDDCQGRGRGPGFDGPADYGGRGPGFDGPADYGETVGRLFARPESG
ncbi:uncharacterized protein LOC118404478 [Branchiostoma floridae]|uniref:Uncharacterized protein LOC118404478 n=1 Tax=Branchiostoma floridae TaxID=7739 RepID=A0A9J7HHE8_BRAFL|nr:uncharacterized protein LOC118404478 [Branchiostoma floridae]